MIISLSTFKEYFLTNVEFYDFFFSPRFSFRYGHHSPRACNAPLKAYYPISGVREEGRPLHGNFPITEEHVNCRCYLDSCLTGGLRVLAEKKTARLCVKKKKKKKKKKKICVWSKKY